MPSEWALERAERLALEIAATSTLTQRPPILAAALDEAEKRGETSHAGSGWAAYRGAAEAAHRLSISLDEAEEQLARLQEPYEAMPSKLWRVGNHYNIHIYEDETPVATALTVAYAKQIVQDHNFALDEARQSHRLSWEGEPLEVRRFNAGRDSILARLKNPDDAMVEAVMSTHCGYQLDVTVRAFVFRCFSRAIADHLEREPATPPTNKQEPLP